MAASDITTYLKKIEHEYSSGRATEHTYRPFLKDLIEALAKGITATNEPKRERCGGPDYVVRRGHTPVGYIEAKDIGKNLDEVEKSEQLKRYFDGLNNIILTDYLQFRWYVGGEMRINVRIARIDSKGKVQKVKAAEEDFREMVRAFLDTSVPTVTGPKDLAKRMASLARIICEISVKAFSDEDKGGSLHHQLTAFKKVLLHDLEPEQFSDMYAQTICYGLFAARCNPACRLPFAREHAAYDIPKTNPFLREMFEYIAGPKLDERLTWAVDDLVNLLDHSDIREILKDFGKRTRQQDPVVHFYETFLSQYNPRMREARGVYYTPEPVVSYIVRSVDHILKKDFGLKDGLADTSKVPVYRRVYDRNAAADCSAGVPLAVSGASSPRFGEVTIRDRGRLPHWIAEHAVYFVTFRLADALPKSVIDTYNFERENILQTAKQQKRDLSPSEVKRLSDLFSERIEAYLDAGSGECYLQQTGIAEFTANALRHFDGKRYRLFAWCIMPNHVHVVFRPIGGYSLDKILHSWKSFSSKEANKILGRTGTFWQREYYDHLVRDETDFLRVVQYVVDNPEKGKLDNWQWVWMDKMCRQDANTTAGETPALQGTRRKKVGETHKVLILDPAAGTGTFLHGVIDEIYGHEQDKGRAGAWSGYVPEHLLPRLFGFELLMAPYAVAHMKLGLQLQEMGYDFGSGERLRIYLTNTLEEAHEMTGLDLFASMIAEEANAAGKVKSEFPVMVVLGNPPYSGHSENKGPWIDGLLRGKDSSTGKATGNYFMVDGKPLGERNPKWLNDDYVKFIRFAQWRIEQTGYGVLAFISNHGYLDNPTFRGMRQCLMDTFDDIYLLDLHGNAKKKETAPDGGKDVNVFDIQQGVAIGIFVKRRNGAKGKKEDARAGRPHDSRQDASATNEECVVRHAHLYGLREIFSKDAHGEKQLSGGKYWWLGMNDLATTEWTELKPESPHYLFIPQDIKLREEYNRGWKITDIMPVNSVGIVTARDKLTIHWSEKDIWDTVCDFAKLPPEEARQKYQLGKDVQDWRVELAQKDVRKSGPAREKIKSVLYRPFDLRHTYYTGESRGFMCRPRPQVMRHMSTGNNIAIHICRQTVSSVWRHLLVTNSMTDDCYVSNKTRERGYTLPLYVYPALRHKDLFDGGDIDQDETGIREPNLAPEFIEAIAKRLGLRFAVYAKEAPVSHEILPAPEAHADLKKAFGPEDVFDYIYAVFHSPSYRSRYAEFLKIDFPRVPLTSSLPLFRDLCRLGDELVKLHLLEKEGPRIASYPIDGTHEVEKVRYSAPGEGAETGRVWINGKQYFGNVPPEVWEFHVGGYQVCNKWLKDRKGRSLNYSDIDHYMKVVSALSETIRIMTAIDETIDRHGGWPLQ